MNILENDDTIKNMIFDDYKEATKKADEALSDVFNKKIKGFQFFQEQHKNRFKITKK